MRRSAFSLIELLVAIVVIMVLVGLLATVVCKAHAQVKKTKEKVQIEHYMKLLPYIDEKPVHVEGNIAYYTNYAFPGILFSVGFEGSERPSL